MASDADLAALRRFYEEAARGNFWVGAEVFDPDIEWRWGPRLAGMTGNRTYRGFTEVEAATKDWFRSFGLFRLELDELVDAGGDTVVAIVRQIARPHGASAEVVQPGADVWTMRDGKAVAHINYDTPEEALRAVGLDPGAA
jgi:ketosteroid isomerase-like protein